MQNILKDDFIKYTLNWIFQDNALGCCDISLGEYTQYK